jgi:hypothetical protein
MCLKMNKTIILLIIITFFSACKRSGENSNRKAVAEVGDKVLYFDEVPRLDENSTNKSDSISLIQGYINRWAKRELMYKKAEENLSQELKVEIEKQLEDTRTNLVIYQYQRQMMLEKMDTLVSEPELENYYSANQNSFILTSNIVKALFIKLPLTARELSKIKLLARSNDQKDLQQLESYCYNNAEKFDDFDEEWVPMNKITLQLPEDIVNEDNFLKRNTYFESSDSRSVYLVSIRDYRVRSTVAPYEYVREDIKRIIWNTRRFDFIQALENGIYNEALKANNFKIY